MTSGVLYASTLSSGSSKALLNAALSAFLKIAENGAAQLLYKLYYEQRQNQQSSFQKSSAILDLAFNDDLLDDVEEAWKTTFYC